MRHVFRIAVVAVVSLGTLAAGAQEQSSKAAAPQPAEEKQYTLEREFVASPAAVYAAAVKALGTRFIIDGSDATRRTIEFHLRRTPISWGYRMSLEIEPGPNGAAVRVTIAKAGRPLLAVRSRSTDLESIFDVIGEALLAPAASAPQANEQTSGSSGRRD